MARIRTIKPDAFTSDSLSQVSRGVRWTFAGLWTYADDDGRARDDVRLIKAALYPIDDDVSLTLIAEDLEQLVAIGCVCRYEVDGKAYLHMPRWSHQRINRPTESKLPDCPKHTDGMSAHVPVDEPAVKPHAQLTEDSPPEGNREGKGRGRTRAKNARPLPLDWSPKDSHRERAAKLELDLDEQVRRFREYFTETGEKHKSWDLTFTNWLRREVQYADEQPKTQARPNTGPRDYVPREVPDHIDPNDTEAYRQWLREAAQ